jgi:hypothetical protein
MNYMLQVTHDSSDLYTTGMYSDQLLYKYHSFVECFKRQWNELRCGHIHYNS